MNFFLALVTQAPGQSLGADQPYRRRDEKRRDSHVEQSRDGARGIVCVEGTQHEVAGEGGLDGDLRGDQIADFPDQDDVGVLPEERPEHIGEAGPGLLVDLDLVNASTVMMFRSGLLIWEIAEYSVLVLPLPVGPVTRTIPKGCVMASSKLSRDSGSNPRRRMSSIRLSRSRRRSTTFSPDSVGTVETRKSSSLTLPPSLRRILMRPS